MRSALIAVVVIALAGTAGAQSRGGRGGGRTGRAVGTGGMTEAIPPPTIGLPLPQIGLPLPTLGLPLPPTGLPPQRIPPVNSGLNRGIDRPPRVNGGPHRGLPQVIYGPVFGWPYLQEAYPYQDPYPYQNPYPPEPPLPPLPQPEDLQPSGGVDIELQPGVNPQIYIDGYFVSSLSDVGDELIVDAGPHTLELHEEGFETLRVDVQVPRDRVVTYRGELKPLNAPNMPSRADRVPAASAPPPAPTTIYVIRGCYVGNVAPTAASLPAGCDVRDAVAFPSR